MNSFIHSEIIHKWIPRRCQGNAQY